MDELDLGVSDLEERFSRASDFVAHNHDKSELQPALLQFYGLFKQCTTGDCDTKRPGLFQLTAKAKWDSWNKLKGIAANEAMTKYVALLTASVPNWLEASKKASWVSVSSPSIPAENLIAEDEKLLSDFIKEGDLENFLKHIEDAEDVNELDESGLGLIHWAADRNQLDILRALIGLPTLDINLQDSDGQTALHYAASCGHKDCLELLVAKGADRGIISTDGETALDIAYDNTIVHLLK